MIFFLKKILKVTLIYFLVFFLRNSFLIFGKIQKEHLKLLISIIQQSEIATNKLKLVLDMGIRRVQMRINNAKEMAEP